MAERDPQLCETLKKVLKLTRGWEVARDHAMMAVSTDNQMRIWYATGAGAELQDGGLLFKCHLGSVDLENPVGERLIYPILELLRVHMCWVESAPATILFW